MLPVASQLNADNLLKVLDLRGKKTHTALNCGNKLQEIQRAMEPAKVHPL